MKPIVLACLTLVACKHSSGKTPMTTKDVDSTYIANQLGPRREVMIPYEDAVRVANDFNEAGPFTSFPTAGETLWVGKVWEAHPGGNGSEGYAFCRLRPGSPVTGFCANLEFDSSEEGDIHTDYLDVKEGKAPHPMSKALQYMRTAPPDEGYNPIVKSDGVSMIMGSPSPRWIRQSGNRMLIIQLFKPDVQSGVPFKSTGAYYEMWLVSSPVQ